MKNKITAMSMILLAVLMCLTACAPAAQTSPADNPEPAAAPETAAPAENQAPAPSEPVKTEDPDALPIFDDIITVKVGSGPYPHYQIFYVAKQWGLDKLCGLNFEISAFANSSPGYQACVRGDVDLTYGCIAEQVAVMKGVPDIRHFAPVGFFKGFFFVGRAGEMKPWEELKSEMGLEAAREYRRQEFKGKTINIIPQKIPLVLDMLEQVGLGEKDVKFMKFADDQKGATAFLSGTGDIYIGGIPQQKKLIEMDGKYVNVGGHEILGPAGVWYDTMSTTDKFMIENREAALRTFACMLLTEKKFAQDMNKFAEVGTAEMSRIAGTEFSVQDFIEMQTIYDQYQTLDILQSEVYNPEHVFYWRYPVEYHLKMAVKDGTLDESFTADTYFGESEKLFHEMLARPDLMKLIEKG